MNSVPSEIANVDLIVRGKLRPSSSGQRWRITSPATGDVVGSVASATREDLLEAIESAHEAFLTWSRLTPYQFIVCCLLFTNVASRPITVLSTTL
jgi:acyl-CoA reductase-like NAD-dependent aldehyde dehydrogenase